MSPGDRNLIVVLNDGETYSFIDGCKVYELTEEGLKALTFNFDFEDVSEKEIIGSVEILDLIGELRLTKDGL